MQDHENKLPNELCDTVTIDILKTKLRKAEDEASGLRRELEQENKAMEVLQTEVVRLREVTSLNWDPCGEECYCSKCDQLMPSDEVDVIDDFNYCPYCGRKTIKGGTPDALDK